MTATPLSWQGPDLILRVRVQPRASRDEVVGIQGDFLKIRITAPPVEGKANSHLIRYLSRLFAIPRSRIELLSGDSGREKRLRIEAPHTIPEQLRPYLPAQKV